MFSKFSQSRDQNSDRVCNVTHVVSGSEAIHYARDHVRTVPIEVGTARAHMQCSRCCRNRSTCVCTWTHRKRMLQYGASEKCFSTARSLVSALACPTVMSFILLWFFTLRRKPDLTDEVSVRNFRRISGRKTRVSLSVFLLFAHRKWICEILKNKRRNLL